MLWGPYAVFTFLPVHFGVGNTSKRVKRQSGLLYWSVLTFVGNSYQFLFTVPSVNLCIDGKCGTLLIEACCTYIDIPRIDMQSRHKDEFHRAVKSCPGIPS